jgi:hypothetical protein
LHPLVWRVLQLLPLFLLQPAHLPLSSLLARLWMLRVSFRQGAGVQSRAQ